MFGDSLKPNTIIQDVIELYKSVHEIQLNTINETPYVMKDQLF